MVGADRSGLRRIAKAGDPEVADPAPKLTWSPDGKRLAFAATFSHPGGKYRWLDSELRTVDLASGAIARLTQHRRPDSNDDRPAWSPDGRFVAFLHYDGRGLGTSTVELVSLERRTITAVAPARVHLSEGDSGFRRPSEVVWAPDGRRLAFTDLDGTKVVRLPGKHIVRVGPPLGVLTPCSTEDVPTPVWSPDSRRLAFLFAPTYSACNLYVVSAGGGRLQAATHSRDFSLDPNAPSWSSDGRRLAATSFPHGDELQTDLRLVDGTRVARLTTTPDAAESDPAYSRTGRLAYSRTNAFVDQVVVRLSSGTEKVVAQGREPTWAPDERRLAYVRDGALYVRAVAGGGERMVVPRELNASDPAWSPRGDLIVFTNHSARGDTLDVVRADGGELHALLALPGDSCDAPHPDGTDQHVVLDGPAYAPTSDVDAPVGGFEPEWSPDGEQIAFTLDTPRDRQSVATVAVVPAQGGAVRQLTPGSSPAWQPIVTASRGSR